MAYFNFERSITDLRILIEYISAFEEFRFQYLSLFIFHLFIRRGWQSVPNDEELDMRHKTTPNNIGIQNSEGSNSNRYVSFEKATIGKTKGF